MNEFKVGFKDTATYQIFRLFRKEFEDFVVSLGEITEICLKTLKFIFLGQISWKEVLNQCYRFGVTSLPITLSIVGMTSVIVAMQVAGEMVKQGAGNYVGMLVTLMIVRESGIIMAGFAIISMIGSSLASEVATMRVTEQIDAITVLDINPIRYLFVPRVLSGILMMPPVLVVSSLFGVIGGAVASNLASGLSYKAYFDSVWYGLYIKDINVSLAKAVVFGFLITVISCSCGYFAKGGAKGVGIATTKAVVWSFIAIVIADMLFAMAFFF